MGLVEFNINWNDLIVDRRRWMDHNFPGDTNPLNSVLGMIEEAGELAHAHLKEKQNIRGTPEEHQKAAKDAVADFTIYSLGVMHHWRCRPANFTYAKFKDMDKALLGMASSAGQIAQALLDHEVRPVFLSSAIMCANAYATLRGWDYEGLVLETWNDVSQRDWIKYPYNGLSS